MFIRHTENSQVMYIKKDTKDRIWSMPSTHSISSKPRMRLSAILSTLTSMSSTLTPMKCLHIAGVQLHTDLVTCLFQIYDMSYCSA